MHTRTRENTFKKTKTVMNKLIIKCPVGIITRCMNPKSLRSIWNIEPAAKGLQLFLLILHTVEQDKDHTVFLNNTARKNLKSKFRSDIEYEDLIDELTHAGWLQETDSPNRYKVLSLKEISKKLGISKQEMYPCRFSEQSLTHWPSFKKEYYLRK